MLITTPMMTLLRSSDNLGQCDSRGKPKEIEILKLDSYASPTSHSHITFLRLKHVRDDQGNTNLLCVHKSRKTRKY